MLSIIVPAHNEQPLLPHTLQAIQAAVKGLGEPHELLVVDDDSTDRTAELAREGGATVVPVRLRKIAAVRNAGARESRGEYLLFVDADTLVTPEVVAAALAAMQGGAVGGGAKFLMEKNAPGWARVMMDFTAWFGGVTKLAAGCYFFARRADFEAVGGFDESYYASEEIWLSRALKARGRFVILNHRVLTSGRKFRQYTLGQTLKQMWRMVAGGPRGLRSNRFSFWYKARRDEPSERME